jgi:hypothetical protein
MLGQSMKEQEAKEFFINPYYAINLSSSLLTDHEAMISKEKWISVNAQLIDELGKEEWLKQLLAILESDQPHSGLSKKR